MSTELVLNNNTVVDCRMVPPQRCDFLLFFFFFYTLDPVSFAIAPCRKRPTLSMLHMPPILPTVLKKACLPACLSTYLPILPPALLPSFPLNSDIVSI